MLGCIKVVGEIVGQEDGLACHKRGTGNHGSTWEVVEMIHLDKFSIIATLLSTRAHRISLVKYLVCTTNLALILYRVIENDRLSLLAA